MPLLTSLAAYWKLEEASGSRADEVGTNTLTDNNTVTSTTGKLGTAALFTRANSEWLDIADNADMSADGTDFSANFWVYPLAGVLSYGLAQKNVQGGGPNEEWSIRRASNKIVDCSIFNGTTRNFFDSTPDALTDDAWNMVTLRFVNSTKVATININNGTNRNTTLTVVPQATSTRFSIGREIDGVAGGYMDGRIDAFGWWRKALSDAEVSELYNAGNGLEYPFVTFVPRAMVY